MLACTEQVALAYHLPVKAIQKVIDIAKTEAKKTKSAGVGPMDIPKPWLPVLATYGFTAKKVETNPCWGIAAGAWILGVEKLYQTSHYENSQPLYPSSIPSIPSDIVNYAIDAQNETGVPARLLLAVAFQESGFNPLAVSSAGAQGLMQFIPATWVHYGQGSPFNPKAAMLAGAKYLRHLVLEFNSWPLALAGYNAGAQAVRSAGNQIPSNSQTENYVPMVLAHYRQIVSISKN